MLWFSTCCPSYTIRVYYMTKLISYCNDYGCLLNLCLFHFFSSFFFQIFFSIFVLFSQSFFFYLFLSLFFSMCKFIMDFSCLVIVTCFNVIFYYFSSLSIFVFLLSVLFLSFLSVFRFPPFAFSLTFILSYH